MEQSPIQYAYVMNPNTGQPAYVYAGTGGFNGPGFQPISLQEAQKAVQGGLQFSPNIAGFSKDQLLSGNIPGSGMVDSYKNPTTGETMTNVPISTIQNLPNIPSNLGGSGAQTVLPVNRADANTNSPAPAQTTVSSQQNQPFALSGNNLKMGSSGQDVVSLQKYLTGLGIYQGKTDGVFGPQTQQAVKDFQSIHGITSDGVVGAQTTQAINSSQSGSPTPLSGGAPTSNPSSSGNTSSLGGGGIVINGSNYSTGDPNTDATLQAIYDAGKTQVAQGYQLNPALQLDQSTIDRFLTQATQSVHPYYAQQIQAIQNQLGRDVGQKTAAYGTNLVNEEQTFKNNLGNYRESAAGNGLAFSGQRGLGETNMQNQEQRTLDYNALTYGNDVGNTARTAEQQIGSGNMNGFQLPSAPRATASLSGNLGGFDTSGSVASNYNPGTYNIGSIGSAEQSAIGSRQQSLINSAYDRLSAGRSYQDLFA